MRNAMCVMAMTAALALSVANVGLCDEAGAVPAVCVSEVPAAAVGQSTHAPDWRVGVLWGQPTSDSLQDRFGSAGGLAVEYSFASSRLQDTAVCLSYQRMRTGEDYVGYGGYEVPEAYTFGFRQQGDVVVLGVKRRFGPGARLGSDGLYAGIGVGLACSHFYYSESGYSPYVTSYDTYRFKPSLSVSVGASFSKNLYAEAIYINPGEWHGTSFSTFGITMGARL